MASFYTVLTHQCDDVRNNTTIDEIQQHLTELLNARQYMLSTRYDFGLPDICAEYTVNYYQRVIEATRALITQFEPRLKIRQITCESNKKAHNQLHLMVVASLQDAGLVSFRAKLGSQIPSSVSLV